MNSSLGVLLASTCILSACGGTAMVLYGDGTKSTNGEYTFVIPRTVVRIEASAGTKSGSNATANGSRKVPKAGNGTNADAGDAAKSPGLTFTAIPVTTDKAGKQLPVFSIIDDSTGGFSLVATTVSSVTYADNLVIQSIGTTITDNRKAAIGGVLGVLGAVAGGSFSAEKVEECSNDLQNFKPFVLEDFAETGSQFQRIIENPCWGYSVVAADVANPDTGAWQVATDPKQSNIPLGVRVGWFPYPACKNYRITVARCADSTAKCAPNNGARAYGAIVSVSDGTQFRKIAFPPKGKISMHSDFCVADVTSDPSPLATNWDVMTELINDTKSLLKPSSGGGGTSTSPNKSKQ